MRRQKLVIAVALLAVLSIGLSVGLYKSLKTNKKLQAYASKLEQHETVYVEQVAALNAKLAVKSKAYDQLKSDLLNKFSETGELNRQLDFYRHILAPEDKQQGFALHSYTFKLLSNRQVSMNVLLVNYDKRHNLVQADLSLSVSGMLNGQQKTIGIEGLLKKGHRFNSKVAFKFYLNIEESLVLPEGFEPKQLQLSATLKRKPYTWQKTIDWVWEK